MTNGMLLIITAALAVIAIVTIIIDYKIIKRARRGRQ